MLFGVVIYSGTIKNERLFGGFDYVYIYGKTC